MKFKKYIISFTYIVSVNGKYSESVTTVSDCLENAVKSAKKKLHSKGISCDMIRGISVQSIEEAP